MASPSVLSLLGYDSLDECLGRDIADSFYAYPADRETFRSAITGTGSVTNYQTVLKKRDGTPVPVSTSSHIYYDANGHPAGIEGTFRDISKQIETDERLRRSETILTAVIEESPVPIFVIDTNHRVIHWNKALEKYSGISVQETLGTTQQWRAFYQHERPCLADLLIQEENSEITRWYSGKYAPSRLIDGAYEAVDFFPEIGEQGCWLYFTAAPIRDAEGTSIGAVEILQDITEQKAAEAKIQTLTQFLESIIMNANVWLMVLDEKGNVIIWNHAAEEITGYPADEVSGGTWIWKSLYPDTAYRHSITTEISHIIMNNNFLQDFQTTIITKSGEQKHILWNTRSLRDNSDNQIKYVAIGIDISGRIQAEEALRESENTLLAIIKGSPIPQFVINQNHQVIQWNKALETYSHLPASEIMGTDLHWRAFYLEKRPCIADLVVDGVDATIGAFNPEHYERSDLVEGGYQSVDFFPMMGKEGSWLFFTAAPIRDEQGHIIGAVETLEDITERRKTEHFLMESEERFRTLFTHANDSIFLYRITPDGLPDLFVEVNETACKQLGYSREELLSLSPKDIFEEDLTENKKGFIKNLQDKGHTTYEAVYITHAGNSVPVEISAHIYEVRGEKMVLSIARDISERKRYEAAIQNTNNKLNLLSRITRHDILNQLTALTGYLDLSEEVADNPEIREFIHKEKKTADTILRQILFTRDYQTIGIQAPRWQDLESTINRAMHLLDTGGVRIHTVVQGCEIFADPLLEKVFFNLIDNSLRYGKNLTQISFSIIKESSPVILVCSDDGGGIPPEEKENIFNRKYFNNTGFGLFLSREILAITGLSIRETGTYGIGAQFEISIPNDSFRNSS